MTGDSRLGQWQPQSVEERLDRMESLAAITQLPARYAQALDARDMDALVELFHPDVQVGRDRAGRSALKEYFTELMARFGVSIHLVANHIVDFIDADTATGVVYCRDELGDVDGDGWRVGAIQYWDDYERVRGEWCITRRRLHRWYLVDADEVPGHGQGCNATPGFRDTGSCRRRIPVGAASGKPWATDARAGVGATRMQR